MILTLRIKKIYLDQIVSGEKVFEYRQDKPYYRKIFKREIRFVVLHYQTSRIVTAKVERISRVKNPFLDLNLDFLNSSKVFRIKLTDVKEYNDRPVSSIRALLADELKTKSLYL